MATTYRFIIIVFILQFLFIQKNIGQNTRNTQTEQQLKDKRSDITNENYKREQNKPQGSSNSRSTSPSSSSSEAWNKTLEENSRIPTKKYGQMSFYIDAVGVDGGIKTGYLISYKPKGQSQSYFTTYLANLNVNNKVWEVFSVNTSLNAKKTTYGMYYGSRIASVSEDNLKLYYPDPNKYLSTEENLMALEMNLAGVKPPEKNVNKEATIINPISVPAAMPADRAKWNYKGLPKFSEVVFKTAIRQAGEMSFYLLGYLIDSMESNNAYGKTKADYAITPQYESDSIFFYHIYNTSTSSFQAENTGSLIKIISAKNAGVRMLSYGQAYTKQELAKLEIKLKQAIEQRDKLTFDYKRKADENKNYNNLIKNAPTATPVTFLVPRQTSWSRTEQSWSYVWEPTNAYKLNIAANDSFFVAEDLRGKGLSYSWKIYLFDFKSSFSNASRGVGGDSLYKIKASDISAASNSSLDETLEKISNELSLFLNGRLKNFVGYISSSETGDIKYWGCWKEANGAHHYGRIDFNTRIKPYYKADNKIIFNANGGKKIIAGRNSLGELIIENGDTVFHNVRLTSNGKLLLNGIDIIEKSVTNPEYIKQRDVLGSKCIINNQDGNVIVKQKDGTLFAGNFDMINGSLPTYLGFMRKPDGNVYFGKFNFSYAINADSYSGKNNPLNCPLILLKNTGDIVIGHFSNEKLLQSGGTVLFSNGDLADADNAYDQITISDTPLSNQPGKDISIKISGVSIIYIDALKKEVYKGYYYNGLRDRSGIIYSADGTSKKVVYKNGLLQ